MTEQYRTFQETLRKVAKGPKGAADMSREQAKSSLSFLFSHQAHPAQVGAFLTAMRFKGTTTEEFKGFLDSLDESPAHFEKLPNPPVGLLNVGAPYDGRKSYLNLTPAASIVAASCGLPVILHTSSMMTPKRGVSSVDVFEELGVPTLLSLEGASRLLGSTGLTCLHSSRFAHAVEGLRQIRQTLLYRSFLHGLETIQNPGQAAYHILGAAHTHFLEKFSEAAWFEGKTKSILAVQGLDGSEEAPLKPVSAFEIRDNQRRAFTLDPKEYGLSHAEPFKAASPSDTAKITRDVAAGEDKIHRDAVIYNAALKLYAAEKFTSIKEALEAARTSIEEGRAAKKLEQLTGPPL